MTFSAILKKFFTLCVFTGLPIVNVYHSFSSSPFWNMEIEGAKGLEKFANHLMVPTHYLFAANKVCRDGDGYVLEQKYHYNRQFGLRTAASLVALPVSIILGPTIKAIAHIDKDVRLRHKNVQEWLDGKGVQSNSGYYQLIGINTQSYLDGEWAECENHTRRPGDENIMVADREALQQIANILNKHAIPFWLDCGTCLGAYRYGGIIPWDFDVDIAIMTSDFQNVLIALRELNPKKYVVQDWSGRDFPGTYLKVYVKESRSLIDIYNFEINPKNKTLQVVVSNVNSLFLPKSWKVREMRYVVPTSFDDIFPLKKAKFDGLVMPVPRNTKKYLQGRYGENIGPNRIYNEVSQRYEKDPKHPYWQLEYAH